MRKVAHSVQTADCEMLPPPARFNVFFFYFVCICVCVMLSPLICSRDCARMDAAN